MIDLHISSCDLVFEERVGTTGGLAICLECRNAPCTCCDKCGERVCICNNWVATCSRCYMPIYGGDEYGGDRKNVNGFIIDTYTCEDCMYRHPEYDGQEAA